MLRVKDEGIRDMRKYDDAPVLTKSFCEDAIQYVLSQIDRNLEKFTDKFPSPSSINNAYEPWDNLEWTPGFWTWMLWLAYEVTGDLKYRLTAEGQLESYRKRLDS